MDVVCTLRTAKLTSGSNTDDLCTLAKISAFKLQRTYSKGQDTTKNRLPHTNNTEIFCSYFDLIGLRHNVGFSARIQLTVQPLLLALRRTPVAGT